MFLFYLSNKGSCYQAQLRQESRVGGRDLCESAEGLSVDNLVGGFISAVSDIDDTGCLHSPSNLRTPESV